MLAAVAAVIRPVLQVHPVPGVQLIALTDVLQLGIENATKFAVEPVALESTVLAATCARFPSVMPLVALWNAYVPAPVRVRKPVAENPVMLSRHVPLAVPQFVPPFTAGVMPVNAAAETFPHPAGPAGPGDTMAWPAVDPAVLSVETGLGVVPNAVTETSVRAHAISFVIFMIYLYPLFATTAFPVIVLERVPATPFPTNTVLVVAP